MPVSTTPMMDVHVYSDEPRSRATSREATSSRIMMHPLAKNTVALGTSNRSTSLSLPMVTLFLRYE